MRTSLVRRLLVVGHAGSSWQCTNSRCSSITDLARCVTTPDAGWFARVDDGSQSGQCTSNHLRNHCDDASTTASSDQGHQGSQQQASGSTSSSSQQQAWHHHWRVSRASLQARATLPPSLPCRQAGSPFQALWWPQQQQHLQPCWRVLHTTSRVQKQQQQQDVVGAPPAVTRQPAADEAAVKEGDAQLTEQQAAAAGGRQRVPGSSFTSLPNLLSLSRVALGPWLAYCIATQQWPLAVGITAYAGVSDGLDGFLARRLGHTSKLGSYLDPLADKLFVGTAVGTMGWLGMLPGWLALLVVGRDSAQVAGMFAYRLRMFGGTWPGAAAFFDVDRALPSSTQVQRQQEEACAGSSSSGDAGVARQAGDSASGEGGLPVIRPLLISKANTALVMLLVAGCMAHQWQGLPPQEALDALELLAGGTTAGSAAAYAWLHWKGRLFSVQPERLSNERRTG